MRPDATDAANPQVRVALAPESPVAEELSFHHYGLTPVEAPDWMREALARDAHDDAGISRGSAPASRG